MASLSMRSIRKTFGKHEVVHGIDLEVQDGEFVVFVGPSGCGKSTMLRMIAGLEEITSGELCIDGVVVNDETPAQRGIAMVFQSYALYPNMTVRENMAFGLEQARLPKAKIDELVQEAAKLLKIEPLLNRRPAQLSGGQSQRVAIGRSIVRNPRVFLFDEPLSNLDAELRVHMRVEIANLRKRLGQTMVYVTHDQVEAMTLADRIVVFNEGRIEQVGTPLDLYNHPCNRFVAGFIGSPKMNFLTGSLGMGDGGCGVASIAGGTLGLSEQAQRLVPRDVDIGVRPEHLRIASTGSSGLPARVVFAEQLGGETFLHCEVAENRNDALVVVKQQGQHSFPQDAVVRLTVDPDQIHIFDRESGKVLTG